MESASPEKVLRYVFQGLEGYLCIATIDRAKAKELRQHWFVYPDEVEAALAYAETMKPKLDIYFSPFLYSEKTRKKHAVVETPCAWADGDECSIDVILRHPSVVIRTSANRNSYLWKFNNPQPAQLGEEISRRIAYFHAEEGMDKGGWDLTQLLRFPGTYNHKHDPAFAITSFIFPHHTFDPHQFDIYPPTSEVNVTTVDEVDLPDASAEEIIEEYRTKLNPRWQELYNSPPNSDWSARLWELECILLEAGMAPAEVFVVASESACNKYNRDGRSPAHLWREIQRAAWKLKEDKDAPPDDTPDILVPTLEPPKLLDNEQKTLVALDETFIERYVRWAKKSSDAAEQYHPLTAFIVLSTLLSGNVKIPTSIGTIIPNLWGLILADTTLTRKSSAMDMGIELLLEADYEALLATDGSVEGFLSALSTRSGRPSLLFRDEVTGFMESVAKKTYLSGMLETLTKLYDGKSMKRVLRSETIDVRNPVLVFFAGGIKTKMLDILDYEHITSGFLPRFIVVTAESDISKIKPIGPPTVQHITERDRLAQDLDAMRRKYATGTTKKNGTSVRLPKEWHATPTDDAWVLYNTFETKLVQAGVESFDPALTTPMMDRLAKSGLKAAALLAASRMCHEKKIIVTEMDVIHAFYYVEKWVQHTSYIINNVGTSADEKKLQRVHQQIEANPGILRSTLMQQLFLQAGEADRIFATLEQRAAIRRTRSGRAERFYPVR